MTANTYSEQYWDYFTTQAGTNKYMNTRLYGTNGTSLYAIGTDTNGYIYTQSPLPGTGSSNIPMSMYWMSSQLTTITQNGKTQYLTYDASGNLTGVSAFL